MGEGEGCSGFVRHGSSFQCWEQSLHQAANSALNMELGFFLGSLCSCVVIKSYQQKEGDYLQCQKAKISGHFNYNEHVFK